MKYGLYISMILVGLSHLLMAHESRPLYIEIEEDGSALRIEMNIPPSVDRANLPSIVLPGVWQRQGELSTLSAESSGYRAVYWYESDDSGIRGQDIHIEYPAFNPSITTIVSYTEEGAEPLIKVLAPDQMSYVIPVDPSRWDVVWDYTRLGIEHIWVGIDHLLFLLCLVIVAGFSRRLIWTITGFTLSHSITLALSTLGWVRLPISAVEACIALSIIFLCYEIVHHHQTRSSLTYRYPVTVSSTFGLLHGFGFASVLAEIGLPKSHLTEALLFFNVGVEIGQLLFIAGIAVLYYMIKSLLHQTQNLKILSAPITLQLFTYTIGILASYWFFDRLF